MQPQALIAVADGIEEIEAVTAIDILRRAKIDVTIAATVKQHITTAHGVKLEADCIIDDCQNKSYDLIVLPGGMPGAENLRDCVTLTQMLQKQQQIGKLYAAICASPVIVLQHHGLLAGLQATCYPSLVEQLAIKETADQEVVVDGNCITSQGPGTAAKFALKLVELLCGIKVAEQIATTMLIS